MPKIPRRGRPRKYKTQAAKQRAYRQRLKRAAQLADMLDQRAARLSGLPVTPPELPDEVTLYEGDFAVVGQQIPDASVDLIVTDPPYGRDFLPALEPLGALAGRVLKPGGSLVVMSGQSCLPEVLHTLQRHLRYQWTLSYRFAGPGIAVWGPHIHNHWRPVVWCTRGPYDGFWQGDVLQGDGKDKRYHAWGQSLGVFVALIERLSLPGDLVLDPACGGGTTGAAAVTTKRRFLGIDRDPEAIAITRARLAALLNKD